MDWRIKATMHEEWCIPIGDDKKFKDLNDEEGDQSRSQVK
jgi:hypothetical protein